MKKKQAVIRKKKSKKKLLANFIERIPYKSIHVALLCLRYFQKIKADKGYLIKADILCDHQDEIEWQKIKLEIICEEIKHMSKKGDVTSFEDVKNFEEILKEIWNQVQNKEELFFNLTNRIIFNSNSDLIENDEIYLALASFKFTGKTELSELLNDGMMQENKTFSMLLFKYKVWNGSDYGHIINDELIEIYYSLYQALRTLEKTIGYDFFWESLSAFNEIRSLYHETESLLEFILEYVLNGKISYHLKKKIYSEAVEFFGDIDYCEETRSMLVGDLKKSAFYNEKLNQLYQDSEGGILITGIDYYNAASSEKFNQKYHNAYKLFQIAFEKGEITEDVFLYEKADYLIKDKKFELALKCLKSVLVYDNSNGLDSIYTNKRIINLYSEWGKREEALRVCKELLIENKNNKVETEDTIQTFLYLCTKMNELNNRECYKMDEIEAVKSALSKVSDDSLVDEELFSTCVMYLESLIQYNGLVKAVEWLFMLAEKYRVLVFGLNNKAVKLYSLVIEYAENVINEKIDIYIESLLWYTDLTEGGFSSNPSEGVSTCEYVKSLLQKHIFEDWDYCQALMLKVKMRFYLESPSNYPEKEYEEDCMNCNYYILTERALEEGSSIGRTYEAWKECFNDAMYVHNEEIAFKALVKMADSIKSWDYDSEEKRICDEVELHLLYIRFYTALGEYEKVREEILAHIRETVETNDIHRWNLGFDEIRNALIEIDELMAAIMFSSYGILCCLKCYSDYNGKL